MAKGLKTLGLEETRALRRRVIRQQALGRIYPADADYITTRLDEISAHIIRMPEKDDEADEL